MTTFYGKFDKDGLPVAFYNDDIWAANKIPGDAVKITRAQWLDFINNSGQRKWLNGKVAVYSGTAAPSTTRRIEWGDLIRTMTADEVTAFDAAVSAAPARFRWLIQKTAYISTDDPDFPTLEAAFIQAFGATRAAELLA